MCMWGRPDQSPTGKKIAAWGDRGSEVGYHSCFRHGQYLLTNVIVENGYLSLQSGHEPSLDTLLKFFKAPAINKLLQKIRSKARQRSSEGQRVAAPRLAFVPDIEHIREITRPLQRLKGISFMAGGPSLLQEHIVLGWEPHHMVEALFQMMCRSLWATVPARRGANKSWLKPQHVLEKDTYGVDEWRQPPANIMAMFTQVEQLREDFSGSMKLLRAFNHCFPVDGKFEKFSQQSHTNVWTEITRRLNNDQIRAIRCVLYGKFRTLRAFPDVHKGKWWKTSSNGVSLLTNRLRDDNPEWAGYLDLKDVLAREGLRNLNRGGRNDVMVRMGR